MKRSFCKTEESRIFIFCSGGFGAFLLGKSAHKQQRQTYCKLDNPVASLYDRVNAKGKPARYGKERSIMVKKILTVFLVLLLLAGSAALLYPAATQVFYEYQEQQAVEQFRTAAEQSALSQPEEQDTSYRQLYREMEEYNQTIQEQQTNLSDPWEESAFDLTAFGLTDSVVGYLSIPAMDLEIPLYLGATEENMTKGATVLGQTSMPIGGENTNCVIAAHRGYQGTPMFRNIERLQEGDTITLTNLWETLTYQVVKCIIINPTDIDAVKIQPGQDLITLVTCHPYRQNYQRYVVYCARVGTDTPLPTAQQLPDVGTPVTPGDTQNYVSSQGDIFWEQVLSWGGAGLALAILTGLAVTGVVQLIRRRKRRRKAKNTAIPG